MLTPGNTLLDKGCVLFKNNHVPFKPCCPTKKPGVYGPTAAGSGTPCRGKALAPGQKQAASASLKNGPPASPSRIKTLAISSHQGATSTHATCKLETTSNDLPGYYDGHLTCAVPHFKCTLQPFPLMRCLIDILACCEVR